MKMKIKKNKNKKKKFVAVGKVIKRNGGNQKGKREKEKRRKILLKVLLKRKRNKSRILFTLKKFKQMFTCQFNRRVIFFLYLNERLSDIALLQFAFSFYIGAYYKK